jgi:3-dehydroquinate synthase
MRQPFSTSIQNCPIYVGDLSQTFDARALQSRYSTIYVLTDSNTERHCFPLFLSKTGLEIRQIRHYSFPAGEANKHLGVCGLIWKDMLAAQLDRGAVAINLGGGVVGDMGGFCAATFKRGIDFIHVPTTLLSATDASIGGKQGVDLDGLKNVIGVFRQPAAVYIDPQFFETLPRRELRSGIAEVLKHGAIAGGEFWDLLKNAASLEDMDWSSLLPRSIEVKVRVVEQDPLEQGLRAVLNFGHTIGHAIETLWMGRAHPLTHGEAVAIGMCCESWLSEWQTETQTRPRYAELAALIARFYDRQPRVAAEADAIWSLMQNDKKNQSGAVRLALPGIEPYTLHWLPVTREMVAESLINGLPDPAR